MNFYRPSLLYEYSIPSSLVGLDACVMCAIFECLFGKHTKNVSWLKLVLSITVKAVVIGVVV